MAYDYDPFISLNTANPPFPENKELISLETHGIIVGKTGTGKSNYLRIVLDALDKRDCNIILLDPHAQTADYALLTSHKDRIFLSGRDFAGSGKSYVGFNSLQFRDNYEASLVSSWLIQAFSTEEAISNGTWGPRLALVFGPLLVSYMIQNRGRNLVDFGNFLSNSDQMKAFCENSGDSSILNFLLPVVKDRRMHYDLVSSTINKLSTITENPFIRRVVSAEQDYSVDLDALLDKGNNLIVPDMEEGAIGINNVRVVASLVLVKIWNSLLRKGPTDRKTYIIIEEVQAIPASIIKTILSEGRKFGVVLIMATQNLVNLKENVVPSLFSNIHNWACFRISNEDSEIVSRELAVGNAQQKLRDVLKTQLFYRVTVTSITGSGKYGPVTQITKKIERDGSANKLEPIKSELLMNHGFPEKMPLEEESASVDIHDLMVSDFMGLLESENIEAKREQKFGEVIPDVQFELAGHTIICEVENSDLLKTFKIAKKMYDYRTYRLMFICRYEDFNKFISVLRRIVEPRHRSSRFSLGADSVPYQGVVKVLPKIYLTVYKDGKFYFHNGIELSEFWTGHVLGESTIVRRARTLPGGNLRVDLLEELIVRISKGGSMSEDILLKVYAKRRIRALIDYIKERGYEEVDINSLLELDRISV